MISNKQTKEQQQQEKLNQIHNEHIQWHMKYNKDKRRCVMSFLVVFSLLMLLLCARWTHQ